MTKRLTELAIQTVGLVEAGADQDAHIVLAKSETPVTHETITVSSGTHDPEEGDHNMSKISDLPEGDLRKHLEEAGIEEVSDDVLEALGSFEAEETSEVDETPVVEETPEVEAPAEETPVAKDDADDDASTEDDDADDDLPIEANPVVKALGDKLDEATDKIAKMEEERDIGKSVATVRETYPSLVAKADELGSVLYRMRKGAVSEADVTFVEEILAQADAIQRESPLFSEAGSSAGSDDSSAEGVIDGIAEGIRKDNPGMTVARSVAEAAMTPEGRAAYSSDDEDTRL